MIKFEIIEIDQSLFGQFKGKLLSDKVLRHDVENSPGNFTLTVSQHEFFTIDFMYKNNYKVGDIIETEDYILTSYAKNKLKGMVIIITKSVRKATIQAI